MCAAFVEGDCLQLIAKLHNANITGLFLIRIPQCCSQFNMGSKRNIRGCDFVSFSLLPPTRLPRTQLFCIDMNSGCPLAFIQLCAVFVEGNRVQLCG